MNRTTWGKCSLICGALIFLSTPAIAQQTGPVSTPQPNCSLQFTFVAAGNSQVLDNRQVGCLNFTVTASVPTTVSALSLLVQTARDNGSASCSTCSWTTFTPATGANPIITPAGGNATFVTAVTTYPDFLRVQLTSVTPAGLGTNHIYGKLYSSIAGGGGGGGGGGGSGCVGTDATPCIVAGPDAGGTTPTQNPIQIGGVDSGGTGFIFPLFVDGFGAIILSGGSPSALADGTSNSIISIANTQGPNSQTQIFPMVFNGATWDRQFACTHEGSLSSSSSGNQQIIALAGGQTIRICAIDFSTSIPETVLITQGTGSNCGTGTGTIKSVLSAINFDFEPGPLYPITASSANAVCINPAAAQAFSVNFTYAQF